MRTGHTRTEYNALGQVADTFENDNDVNLVRRQTHNDYDAKGNLVRTLYPDGTEVRTAYGDMGRAVWTTDRYKITTTIDPKTGAIAIDNTTKALATFTVYDALGRVACSRRPHQPLALL